jgi:hypothetical protein
LSCPAKIEHYRKQNSNQFVQSDFAGKKPKRASTGGKGTKKRVDQVESSTESLIAAVDVDYVPDDGSKSTGKKRRTVSSGSDSDTKFFMRKVTSGRGRGRGNGKGKGKGTLAKPRSENDKDDDAPAALKKLRSENDVVEDASVAVKKGRGRPKKQRANLLSQPKLTSTKGKRGRPKKVTKVGIVADSMSLSTLSSESSDDELKLPSSESSEDELKPPPRRTPMIKQHLKSTTTKFVTDFGESDEMIDASQT